MTELTILFLILIIALSIVSVGAVTVVLIEAFDLPEEGEEPWELDPHVSLRNGREICLAVQSMAEAGGYYADPEFLEPIAERLERYDPVLAAEFRSEVSDLAEEMGWDE